MRLDHGFLNRDKNVDSIVTWNNFNPITDNISTLMLGTMKKHNNIKVEEYTLEPKPNTSSNFKTKCGNNGVIQ